MMEFVYPHTHLVAGVDEVGRGPLVGAVVTAAVILDPAKPIVGLNDSKKLSEKRRLALFDEIKEKALCWSLGRAEPHEIDELNILHATMLAMQRAVAGLRVSPEFVLIDGNRCPPLPVCAFPLSLFLLMVTAVRRCRCRHWRSSKATAEWRKSAPRLFWLK